jgi:hypothetical protein
MALEMIVGSQDEIPEGLQEHYEERDGKFVLQAKGVFSKLDRDALKRSLEAERTDHKATKGKVGAFGEFTPESIATLVEEHEQRGLDLDASKDKDNPEAQEKAIEARVRAKMGPHDREMDKLRTENQGLTTQNSELVSTATTGSINRAAVKAFNAIEGHNEHALDDVELWAKVTFEMVDGKPVSKDGVGVTPGLTPAETLKDMRDGNKRPHWFGETVGAGAHGSTSLKFDGESPFKLVKGGKKNGHVTNMTKCNTILGADPAKGKRMIVAAGAQTWFPQLFPET